MRFSNRAEAADLLAERLASSRGQRPLVLGLPRGGVPMARRIADALEGELDVVLVKKLPAPGQPELAIGAIDESGHIVEGDYFALASADYVREARRAQLDVLRQRRLAYGRVHGPISRADRVVILVDDGIATGASMEAAIKAIRAQGPRRLIVAVGVAPTSTIARLRPLADWVVCLHATEPFGAVGRFYEDFSEVSDDEVIAALATSPSVS